MEKLNGIRSIGWRLIRRCGLLGLIAVSVVTARAQTTVEEKLAALEVRIQQLEQELAAAKGSSSVAQTSEQGTAGIGNLLKQASQTNEHKPAPFIRPAVLTTTSPTVQPEPLATLDPGPALGQEQQAAPPAAPAAPAGPMYYPLTPVSGIYTSSSDKDIGKLTGIKLFEGTKVRGWISTFYDYNFNNPENSVVNALQPLSVVKGDNITVEGRLFDVHSNNITLDLAEVEFEKVPDKGQVGFKLDIAYGNTQHLIRSAIQGATGTSSINILEETFQHASISYVAPVAKGIRFDFGKFVTHIGGETIESIKNPNFSRGFLYTYAIPLQDYGVRMHYDFNDKVYEEVYLLNGWNVGYDNNRGKTYGYTLSYSPNPHFSFVGNYLGGPEQAGISSTDHWRHLGDFEIYINPTPKFRTMTNFDVAMEGKVLPDGSDTSWQGVSEVLRYRMSERFDPSFRFEWMRDKDGFATGLAQNLWGFTATFDYFLGKGENDKILVRPEFRYDHSNGASFFSHDGSPRSRKYQPTVGLDLVYFF